MGRPAKPTHLKVLHGDRPDRINTAEPQPAATVVAPPYPLVRDVQAVWDRLAPDLVAKGVLTSWDVDAFAAFCETAAMLRKAWQGAHRGVLVPGKRGEERVYNRAMQGVRDLTAQLATLGGRFGLTPSDRARLTMTPEEQPDGKDARRLLS